MSSSEPRGLSRPLTPLCPSGIQEWEAGHIRRLYAGGGHSHLDLAHLHGVSKLAIWKVLNPGRSKP